MAPAAQLIQTYDRSHPGAASATLWVPTDLTQVHRAFAGVRGILTVLVVFGHASQAFIPPDGAAPMTGWESLLAHAARVLGALRMPAFFVLAGITLWRGLSTDGYRAHVTKRVLRLGIPFVVVLSVVNPLDLWLRVRFGSQLGLAHQPALLDRALPGLLDGTAVLHLWFVQVLLYASLLSPVLMAAVVRMGQQTKCLVIAILLTVGAGAQFLAWHLDDAVRFHVSTEVVTPSQLLLALRFLMIGMILASDPMLLVRLLGQVRPAIVTVIVTSTILCGVEGNGASPAWLILTALASALLPVAAIVVLTALCRMSPRWRQSFAALDASGYTIYLLHYVLVMAFTVVFTSQFGAGSAAFLLSFGLAIAIPLLIDRHVVRQSATAAFLLNGVLARSRPQRVGMTTTSIPARREQLAA